MTNNAKNNKSGSNPMSNFLKVTVTDSLTIGNMAEQ